jgi:opacity protein-like surface antigen
VKALKQLVLILAVLSLSTPALAQDPGRPGSGTSDWGIRVGLATDPDQVVGGVHLFETEIAKNVYLVPNFELGIGDDFLILAGTASFHYRFTTDAKVTPYAGGGPTVALARWDNPNGDNETDTEIALRITGGLIWRLNSGTEMFAELNLISGDLHDAQAMVGWRF